MSRAKKGDSPSAMVIVGRCLSMRIAIRMLRVARKRLRIDGPTSAWVFAGADVMDRQIAEMQTGLVEQMRGLWPTAAEELEQFLKEDPELPATLRPPYPAVPVSEGA